MNYSLVLWHHTAWSNFGGRAQFLLFGLPSFKVFTYRRVRRVRVPLQIHKNLYTFRILAWKLVGLLCSCFFFSLYQMTPLHVAAERGHTKIVDYLVSKGADINSQDKKGVVMHDYSNDSVVLLI